ncbi:MAG: response regulator [Crenarchaeota archaeon]|nr:MAG: response regulator [Thermoproteota archaeon]RDJ34500.1 MAG: response regulator [Thermoproteota archaeon]RDJ34840.1 MAG: response regulator [Thermoproteota archaeon]RDJ38557.1 MAG: response regulator [Thermoproteota archaeon]
MVRVLVVDDDPDTVEIFSEYLSIRGVQVVGTGYNGKEAVELYQKYRPDVVFLDCMMPEFDGFYALGNIQQIDPSAKTIMVTGDLTQKTKMLFEKMGVSGVIFKPYEIDDVIKILNDVVSGKIILPTV